MLTESVRLEWSVSAKLLPWKWRGRGDKECNDIKHKNINRTDFENSELIEMEAQFKKRMFKYSITTLNYKLNKF